MEKHDLKVYYGVFDENMIPTDVEDVTTVIMEKFMVGTKIVIPAKKAFHKIFHTSAGHQRKFLQIISGSQKHNIIEDRYVFDIVIDLCNRKKSIKLIYYAYINRASDWKVIISGQLQQLKSLGLLDEVDLYIHITDITAVFDDVIRLIKAMHNNVTISTSAENHFEYPAIRLIHDLAIEDPESIYIYLHSKGMSYNKGIRNEQEEVLLTTTFEDWRRKLENFKNDRINKMGLFPAIGDDKDNELVGVRGGWIWFNFWYAKGTYIVNCDPPQVTENRYFFEHWLGLQNGTLTIGNDCHNLSSHRNKKYFGIFPRKKRRYFKPSEAGNALIKLVEKGKERSKQ